MIIMMKTTASATKCKKGRGRLGEVLTRKRDTPLLAPNCTGVRSMMNAQNTLPKMHVVLSFLWL